MKQKSSIILILAMIVTTQVFSQSGNPVKKIFAYKQASLPGILPRYSEDDNENHQAQRKQNYNYWFYLCLKQDQDITLSAIWINGKKHELKTENVSALPVKKIIYNGSDKNDTVTMVPFTKNKVMLVHPSGESENQKKESKYLSGLIEKNELVIVFSWKNKKYYSVVKKLKELPPDARP